MTKTISAFRINTALEELDSNSAAFTVFRRKESFIPSFFLVSSSWEAELNEANVVTVFAEIKILEGNEPHVKTFDSALDEEQVSKAALETGLIGSLSASGELAAAF